MTTNTDKNISVHSEWKVQAKVEMDSGDSAVVTFNQADYDGTLSVRVGDNCLRVTVHEIEQLAKAAWRVVNRRDAIDRALRSDAEGASA
ncbi:MAG: hypothetical protein AAF196_09085 [Planctomycetota bacterium]